MPGANNWLSRLDQIIVDNIVTGCLDNKKLAAGIDISERHLIRKVKELTGLPPQQYVRRHRLKLARQYLERGTFRTVKDTAAAVGYVSTSYFISQYEQKYGKRPLEVLQQWGWR